MSNDPFDQPVPPADPPPAADPRSFDPRYTGPPPYSGSAGGPPPYSGSAGGPPPSPQARQLVRDPYTKLGGVSSGLSHHYGIDVSLIRLAFVVFTLTTGFGLLVYLMAWIVIPRAKFWPPIGVRRPARSLSLRDLGIGVLVMGVVVGLFVNGGTFSEVLIPLILIGGGIWLLTQPSAETAPDRTAPRPNPPPAGSWAPPVGAAQPRYDQTAGWAPSGQPVDTIAPPPNLPPPNLSPTGSPVPPRSRRSRFLLIGLFGFIILLPILLIGGAIIGLVASDFDAEVGFDAVYRPATTADIPESLSHDAGDITLDLTELSSSDFDEQQMVDLDIEIGDLVIIVPEDLAVDIEAGTGLGSVDVFDDSESGVDSNVTYGDDNPDLSLEVNVGIGSVTVERP